MNGEFELALNASVKYRLMRNYKGMKTSKDTDNRRTIFKLRDECSGRSTNLGFRFKNKGDPETLGWI